MSSSEPAGAALLVGTASKPGGPSTDNANTRGPFESLKFAKVAAPLGFVSGSFSAPRFSATGVPQVWRGGVFYWYALPCIIFLLLLYNSIFLISLLIKFIRSIFHPLGRSIWIISCIIFILTLHT